MSSTPLGVFLQQCTPLLAAAAFLSLCLWVGVLFSVSWLSGRARWMADGTEVGELAAALNRRWAIPCFVIGLVSAFLWLYAAPHTSLAEAPLAVGVGAALVLLGVHSSVSRRVALVARGSVAATRGEGLRRVVLLLSIATVVAMAAFRIGVR